MVVDALAKIATDLKWSKFFVAFVLMGFMTSVPELFVGISSALNKVPDLSVGNVIGANVVNLTLVMGLAAILARGIKIETSVAKKDAILVIVYVGIVILLLLDGVLSRMEGVILIFLFFVYVLQLYYASQRKFPHFLIRILQGLRVNVNGEKFHREYEVNGGDKRKFSQIVGDLIRFGVGMILLIASARLIVYLADKVATGLGLPMVLLGLVILSIGTTLPELTFGIKAVMKGRKEMILGNAFGSIIVNTVLVLGIVALINPIEIGAFSVFLLSGLFLIFLLGIFAIFVRTKGHLSWREGMVLVMLYVLFVLGEFLLNYAEH